MSVVLLYIERWLKAPTMLEDGTLVPTDRGTPQGGVVSPILANLFLHYVFDVWMGGCFQCRLNGTRVISSATAALNARPWHCVGSWIGGSPNVDWCSIQRRRRWSTARTPTPTGEYPICCFDFLGYTFRPRRAKWRGELYGLSLLPAASPKALKAIRRAVRGWSLQTRSDKALDDLIRMFNPYIRGWINYYRRFYKSELYPTLRRIDAFLVRWARRKFKRLRQRPKARETGWYG